MHFHDTIMKMLRDAEAEFASVNDLPALLFSLADEHIFYANRALKLQKDGELHPLKKRAIQYEIDYLHNPRSPLQRKLVQLGYGTTRAFRRR